MLAVLMIRVVYTRVYNFCIQPDTLSILQGEVCSNGTRIFVQRGIYDSFLSEFVKHTQKLKVGDPYGEDTTVGATICKDHAEKVMGYIKLAKEEGCTIQCGGERVVLPG